MNDKLEMILCLFGMFFMLMFMEFLKYRHKEKYKDYYYVKEYETPERPIKDIVAKEQEKLNNLLFQRGKIKHSPKRTV